MQPSIEIFGITIMEPVITLTDLLVTAVCLWAYMKLRKHNGRVRVLFYYRMFFLNMAFATFIGGIVGHAFLYLFNFYWKLPGWIVSMVSIAFLERVSIERARPLIKKRLAYFFMRLNFIELTAFVVIAILTLNFFYVEIHAAYGMLIVVLSFELYILFKIKDAASKYMIGAVAITTLAALVHIAKFSLSEWFNFFDIGHVLVAISAYLIYRSAHLQEPVVVTA